MGGWREVLVTRMLRGYPRRLGHRYFEAGTLPAGWHAHTTVSGSSNLETLGASVAPEESHLVVTCIRGNRLNVGSFRLG